MNLRNISRVPRVESREPNQADNRPDGTGVPIRHLRPRPGSTFQHPASRFSQPATCNLHPATTCSLRNTDGFWELSFYGRSAVLKQHPALFYLAWLLAHAPAEPISALDLAGQAFALFRLHPDLLRSAPWLCRQQRDADVAEVLFKKIAALEAILDRPYESEVEKLEAERELIYIYHLQATYFAELLPPGEKTAERVAAELFDPHASLIVALDAQGNPHPIIRAFALHLLVHVLLPSMRASRGAAGARYVYQSLKSKV